MCRSVQALSYTSKAALAAAKIRSAPWNYVHCAPSGYTAPLLLPIAPIFDSPRQASMIGRAETSFLPYLRILSNLHVECFLKKRDFSSGLTLYYQLVE